MERWSPNAVRSALEAHRFEAPEPLDRRAAVAIVLHFSRGAGSTEADLEQGAEEDADRGLGEGPEVLLMKRVVRAGDPWSGQISLPGGRMEPEDDDLLATAIRETHEELGVALHESAEVWGELEPLRARARGKIVPLDVSPFVFLAHGRPRFHVPGDEAEDAFWFPLRQAASGSLDVPYYLEHEGQRLKLPSWSFEGHTVWGMTHRILSGLIALLR